MRPEDRPRPAGGPCPAALALAALCLAPLSAGCREKANPPAPTTAKAEADLKLPKEVPGLKEAGLAEDKPGAAEVMVKAVYDRGEKETYTYDPKFAAGTIKGSCRFAKPPKGRKVVLGASEPVDLGGADAIKNPEPKELEYYRVIGIRKPRWYVTHGRGKHAWHQPINVVIRLRGVTSGRQVPLTRPVMMVRQGLIGPGDDSNSGGNNVQFCPVHERAQFTTWDEHPADILVRHMETGEVILHKTVRYAHGQKGVLNEAGHLKYKPEFVITPPIRKPGGYVVTDTRHPWAKGYLFVVDNPYVAATIHRRKISVFQIDNVPPGRHTVEVWHPVYEPVERTFEMDVEANRIHEVLIRLHPPTVPDEPAAPAKDPGTGKGK